MFSAIIFGQDKRFNNTLIRVIRNISLEFKITINVISTSEIKKLYSSNQKSIDFIFFTDNNSLYTDLYFYKELRKFFLNTVFVFIYESTSNSMHINPSKINRILELHPCKFLSKKFIHLELKKEFESILQYAMDIHKNSFLYLKKRGHHYQIRIDDILYIEKTKHGSVVYLDNIFKHEEKVFCSNRLKEIYEDNRAFFSIPHSSYIVNKSKIFDFSSKELRLSNGLILSISKSKYPDFHSDMHQFSKK